MAGGGALGDRAPGITARLLLRGGRSHGDRFLAGHGVAGLVLEGAASAGDGSDEGEGNSLEHFHRLLWRANAALSGPLDTARPSGWKRVVKLPCSRQLALRTTRRAPGPCNGAEVAPPCAFCAILRGEVPASFVLR